MTIALINPANGLPLTLGRHAARDAEGASFPLVNGALRLCGADNYADNFGKQWKRFDRTQLDGEGSLTDLSSRRLFGTTLWQPADLADKDVLEVGSGAGRFSRVLLRETAANLYSLDFSAAVDANFANNGAIAPDRFHLFQASIYDMPFPDSSFDKVFCLGVLQHTPDFERSVRSLVAKAKPGGEIVVDFYPIRGFWTKIHAKYLLRPVTRRMDHDRLLRLIERHVPWLIKASNLLAKTPLSPLRRFLPLVDLETLPSGLSREEFREWAVLDTFDQFSPEYDNPQRPGAVARMMERAGAQVTFAGFNNVDGNSTAIVRAAKR